MAPPEFITFMKAVSESLAVCPVSKVVFDEQLWDQLWTSIVVHGQLSVCRRTANEVLSFQEELVDIIDSAISKVSGAKLNCHHSSRTDSGTIGRCPLFLQVVLDID